jgi:hypothetical protein
MAHLVHIDSAVLRDQSVNRRLTTTGAKVRKRLVCNRSTPERCKLVATRAALAGS